MHLKKGKLPGFTLIELIVVIGIIAILAAIVILAVNPGRQFASARNTTRRNNVKAIYDAIVQHAADNNGNITSKITTTAQTICNGDTGVTCGSNVDLRSELVTGGYIKDIPKDPQGGTNANTRYQVFVAENGNLNVLALNGELGQTIAYNPAILSNYALNFDGSDDVVDVPNATSLNFASANQYTVEFWYRPSSVSGIKYVFDKQASLRGYYAYRSGNSLFFGFPNASSWNELSTGPVFSANTWYHVAAVHNGTSQVVYVNGSSAAVRNLTVSLADSTTFLRFGGYTGGSSYFETMQLDDFRLYNRALSGTEIAQRYAGASITSGLVGKWTFSEGSGTTAGDSSGNGNNGTLVNGPTWVQR